MIIRSSFIAEGAAAREGEDGRLESGRGARKLEYAKRDAYEGAGWRRGGGFGEEVRFWEHAAQRAGREMWGGEGYEEMHKNVHLRVVCEE